MKNNIMKFAAFVSAAAALTLSSCSLDNFDGPDAQIFGEVRDAETGELVGQDIGGGTDIVYMEYGYENPEEQRMSFKVDGTYRNNLMFSGEYDFYFYEKNFVFEESDKIVRHKIKKGENRLDFKVTPYVRIKDAVIKKEGDKVVATFKITPAVDHQVRNVALFAHPDFVVGDSYKDHIVTQDIRESFNGETREYRLEMSLNNFVKGKPWYFRVGSVVDTANSKYNYAPAVKIEL